MLADNLDKISLESGEMGKFLLEENGKDILGLRLLQLSDALDLLGEFFFQPETRRRMMDKSAQNAYR